MGDEEDREEGHKGIKGGCQGQKAYPLSGGLSTGQTHRQAKRPSDLNELTSPRAVANNPILE